jgi:hypothetical protein
MIAPNRRVSAGGITSLRRYQRAIDKLARLGYTSVPDVTDPAAPNLIGVWQWQPAGITYDMKPFRQAERWYLALALENQRLAARGPCGIAIV